MWPETMRNGTDRRLLRRLRDVWEYVGGALGLVLSGLILYAMWGYLYDR